MRIQCLAAALMLIIVLLMANCAGTATPSAESYKIGFIGHISGYAADSFKPTWEGFVWAVEDANEKGGINGRQIEPIVYDGACDPAKSVLAARKLITEDEVLMVVLGGLEEPADAMKPRCQEAEITLLSLAPTWNLLGVPAEWCFSQVPFHAWTMGNFYEFCKARGFERVGFLAATTGYGMGGMYALKDSASRAGITIVAAEQFGPTDVDMRPQLMKIKGKNPDVLYVYAVVPAGVLAIEQAKALRLDVPIYVIPPLVDPVYLASKPEALEGVFGQIAGLGDIYETLPKDDPVRQHVERLDAAMRETRGHGTGMMNRWGYDLALITFEALRLADLTDEDLGNLKVARSKLRGAMEMVDIVGAEKSYRYTPQDHAGMLPPDATMTVQNSTVTFLEWVDPTQSLYFPEGLNLLVGMQ